MIRRALGLACFALAAGCMSGRPGPVVPATANAGAPRSDSMRVFYDSLANARAADTLLPETPERLGAPRALSADSLADLAWLDVLRDTTLIALERRALEQNRDLAMARGRIREARAAGTVARSALFPSLDANANVSRNRLAFGSFTIPPYTQWRATANVSWELNFLALGSGLAAANADIATQDAAERAAALALVSEVAAGYLELLELDQERRTAEQTLDSRRSMLALARERYAGGLTSELDVRQFEAQVAVPAARLAQVEQAVALQEHALNVLLGEGPAPIPRGTSLAQAARAISVPDSVPVALIERRPDVEAAGYAFRAAAARAGVAAATRLPTLSITGSYGGQSAALGDLANANSRVYQIMAGISIPLFAGGRRSGQQHAAEARADQAHAAYQQAVLTALQEAGDALVAVRSARDQLAAQETQATALRRALALARMRYQGGVSNYLEVLDAQRSLFEAELAESQAQLQQLLAAVRLYKALGGSWPDEQ